MPPDTDAVIKPWPPATLTTSVPPRQVPVSHELLDKLVYDLTAAVENLKLYGFPREDPQQTP